MNAIRDIVLGVVREALRERGLSTVVVLRPDSPGHRLVVEWLRAGGIDVAAGAPGTRSALVLDPAPKDVILLEGPRPGADVLPLGDVWGSRVRTRDADARLTPVEAALAAAFEGARGLSVLETMLPARDAADVRDRILRAAPLLRPPVVPKLTDWTPGLDPGP